MAYKVAIVGLGKIARDQHLPSIEKNPDYELAGIVTSGDGIAGIDRFRTLSELLAARPDIDVISLCTPPQVRFELAVEAISAKRHVMLEKPPGATVAEVDALRAMAERNGIFLHATWHSRHAQGVEPARDWLKDKTIEHVRIDWREDVRRWHPGQEWIWQPGGLGVFDPGINALSILTHILPAPVHVTASRLEVPSNRQTPIGARIDFKSETGHVVEADFDWRQEGPQTWDITVRTSDGELVLSGGGSILTIDGDKQVSAPDTEYDGIYRHFAALLREGRSDVDTTPLQLVADAFMLGEIKHVEPFNH